MSRIEVYNKFLDSTYKLILSGQSYRQLTKLMESIMFEHMNHGYKGVDSVASEEEYFAECKNFIKNSLNTKGLIEYIITCNILHNYGMNTSIEYNSNDIYKLRDAVRKTTTVFNSVVDVIELFEEGYYLDTVNAIAKMIKQILIFKLMPVDKDFSADSVEISSLILAAKAKNLIDVDHHKVLRAYVYDKMCIINGRCNRLDTVLQLNYLDTDCYLNLIAEALLPIIDK